MTARRVLLKAFDALIDKAPDAQLFGLARAIDGLRTEDPADYCRLLGDGLLDDLFWLILIERNDRARAG